MTLPKTNYCVFSDFVKAEQEDIDATNFITE